MGFSVGNDIVCAEPADLVYRPRDVWHTFWNATDEPARLLEIISPGGIGQMFAEIAEFTAYGGDPEVAAALPDRHGLLLDLESVRALLEKEGLVVAPLD